MLRKIICLLLIVITTGCSNPGDRREFYFLLNEQYRMTECADMHDEKPNAHPYFSQFNDDKVFYTQFFDTEKSILELRVEVDELNRPHGYGFVELYDIHGKEIISLKIDNYLANQINYQWGIFVYEKFSKTESIYLLTKECVRFRYPVYIEDEGKEVLITFNYTLNKTYEYPDAFKDLSWMV